MLGQMRLAAGRRGTFNIMSSGYGSLHLKSNNSKPCRAISGWFSSLGKGEALSISTSHLKHIRSGWNNFLAVNETRRSHCFSTGPPYMGKRRRRFPICSEDGCSTQAHYGWEGGRKDFCSKHKKEGMMHLSVRLCTHPTKCTKVASFGFPGGYPTHCGSHKLDGMEDVKNRRCEEPGCTRQPAFDVPGGKGSYCGAHKEPRMEDVKNRRCKEPGCRSLNPAFDVPGGKGNYCSSHKKAGMLDVRNRRCEEPGCELHPSYGDPNTKVRRFCASHKLQHMVSLRSRKPKDVAETSP